MNRRIVMMHKDPDEICSCRKSSGSFARDMFFSRSLWSLLHILQHIVNGTVHSLFKVTFVLPVNRLQIHLQHRLNPD